MSFRDPFATQALGQTQAVAFDAGLRAYMLRIYNYMASALTLTGIVALAAANIPAIQELLYNVQDGQIVGIKGLGYVVMFAPIGLVLWLGMGLSRMSTGTAQVIYWSYAALMGLSLSSIFFAYTGESIARTFFVTAGTFGAMSLYGYTTKRDLSGMGSFLIMGVFGLIIASVVNMFLHSSGLSFAVSVLGVLIFTGLTAYDTQKLKAIYYQMGAGGEMLAKATIMGALSLYLDFINMFMYMLRFMGDRR
jgi:FtsH-binding integral membrane protein